MIRKLSKIAFTTSQASIAGALIVAFVSFTIMSGWLAHDALLTHAMLPFTPMQFNTALCFFLCSMAGLYLKNSPKLSWYAGALASLLAFVTLAQYILSADLSIDTLFVEPFITVNAGNPGRMAPITALALCLSGLALMFHARPGANRQAHAFVAVFSGSLIVVIGLLPLFELILNPPAAEDTGHFAHISFCSGACFSIIGAIIVMQAPRTADKSQQWLPVLVFIGIIVMTYFLSAAVAHQEEEDFNSMLQVEADHIARDAELHLMNFYHALDRIANRWSAAGGTQRPLWEADATEYVRDYPYLSALSKTDVDTRVQWLIPTGKTTEKAYGFKLDSEPRRATAIAKVLRTGKGQTTKIVELIGGGKGFLYIMPLYSDHRFQGLQVAVMRIREIFGAILYPESTKNFYVTAEEDGPFYSTLPTGREHARQWHKSAIIHNGDSVWKVTISPTERLLASKNSIIPLALMVVGFLGAALITLCIILMLKWRQNANALHVRERALEESDRLNKAILSSAGHLIVATDTEGTVLVFNRRAEEVLGWTAEEVIGRHTPTLWHLPAEMVDRACELTREMGEPVMPDFETLSIKSSRHEPDRREWTYLRKDGSTFPASLNVTPLLDAKKRLVGYLGIIEDISERKRQEQALKISEETFRLAMEHASIGMALISPMGQFIRCNKALCDLIGYTKEEMQSINFKSITHPGDLEKDTAYMMQMLKGRIQTYQMEKRYLHKDGHMIWSLLNVSLVRDASGFPDYFISQIQDVTQRKKADQLKSDFVSTVSHELRTPLTSIRGSLGLLLGGIGGSLEDKSRGLVDIAYKNCERLVLLINDILDIEKLQSGEMQFELKQEDLRSILMQSVALNQSYGEKYNVRFIVEDPLDSAVVTVDAGRLLQVMANLLSNAAKFSPSGRDVRIFTTRNEAGIRVCVKDSGPGIPSEFRQRIFQKFAQANSSDSRMKGGTGLGLTITKSIVEHMGGTIHFTCPEEGGTIFYFDLPIVFENRQAQGFPPISTPISGNAL